MVWNESKQGAGSVCAFGGPWYSISMPETLNYLDRSFETLSKPPIQEAVLEIKARATTQWERARITAQLKALAPEFTEADSKHSYQAEVELGAGVVNVAHKAEDSGWVGLRARMADQSRVTQFLRDSFIYSQLPPYQTWQSFLATGLKYWSVHKQLANPEEITRIGLRYINRLCVPEAQIRIEDYLVGAPKEPKGLDFPMVGFFHRDIYRMPVKDFQIQITKTVRSEGELAIALLVDIDVSLSKVLSADTKFLEEALEEMRWLKNAAFFGSITETALNLIK